MKHLPKKQQKITVLLSVSFAATVLLIGFGMVLWTFSIAKKATISEIRTTFEQRHLIADIVLAGWAQNLENQLKSVTADAELLQAITEENTDIIDVVLDEQLLLDENEIFDILILFRADGSVVVDASSPLYNIKDSYPLLSGQRMHFTTTTPIVLNPNNEPLAALINSRPIILRGEGRVLGYLVGGSVLNNNSRFIEAIRGNTKSLAVVMTTENTLIASSEFFTSPITQTMLEHSVSQVHTPVAVHKSFLDSSQHMYLYGAKTPFIISIAISTARQYDLHTDYFIGAIVSLLVTLSILFLVIFLLRNYLTKSFHNLMDFTQNILSGNMNTNYTEGWIEEFNIIGLAMEEMVDSMQLTSAQLAEVGAKFRAIFDQTYQMTALLTPTGELLDLNRTALEQTTEHADSIIGKPFTEFSFALGFREAHQTVADAIERAAAGETVRYEAVNRDNPAHPIYIDVTIKPLVNENSELYALLVESRDITEQKRAETEAVRIRGYLKNVIDSMPSALIGVNHLGQIEFLNDKCREIFSIPDTDPRGKTIDTLIPNMEWLPESVRNALELRAPQRHVKLTILINKQQKYVDVTVYPLTAGGFTGAVIRVDDITDRVHMDEIMIQTEKMMSVGGLAAGMAHEINNPLAGIIQNTQVISNRLMEQSPKNSRAAEEAGITIEQVQTYVQNRGIPGMIQAVLESGQRAAVIVKNMLNFSRQSASQFLPQNINQMIDETIELAASDYDLKKKYDFRNITIKRNYAENLPPVVCEGSKIQQVLLNLLKNGAQAMGDDTKDDHIFTITTAQENGNVVITIADNGPGMTDDVKKRIFEPFFTTKEVGVGTGLGLSISYFIITENHNGTITVESRPGKGTTFTIKLPFRNMNTTQ